MSGSTIYIYIYGCFQKTNGTTKSSIFIGFSNIINYIYKPSILGYPLFLETSIYINKAKIFAGQFDSNVGQLVRYMPNDVALNLLAAGCYKWVSKTKPVGFQRRDPPFGSVSVRSTLMSQHTMTT